MRNAVLRDSFISHLVHMMIMVYLHINLIGTSWHLTPFLCCHTSLHSRATSLHSAKLLDHLYQKRLSKMRSCFKKRQKTMTLVGCPLNLMTIRAAPSTLRLSETKQT